VKVEAPGFYVPAMLGHDTRLDAGRATLEIVLARGLVVEGQVVDQEERPRAGAVVRGRPEFPQGDMTGYVNEWKGTTAADGRFRIDALPALPLTLEAALAGHVPARSDRLQPVAGAPLPEVRLVLGAVAASAQAVRGSARRADGTAVPGTLVTALPVVDSRRWTQEGTAYYAVCGPDGAFAFEDLDPGLAWRVAANATGFASSPAAVAVGGDRPALDLRLERRPVLRGRVLTQAGAPVPDAKVHCGVEGGPGVETSSALDGGFAFDTLAVGTYDLRVTDVMGRQAGAAVRAELTAATDPPPVTLRVEALHVLGGIVVDGAGTPVVGVQVGLGGFGHGVFTYTDPEGRFAFTLLAPGEFALALRAETIGGSYATGRTDHRIVDTHRRRLTVEVVLVGPDGTIAKMGTVMFRTGRRSDDGTRSSGAGARTGGGRFWTDIDPDETTFDLEVTTLLDTSGRRMNVRPQTWRDLDPAKSPFTFRLESGRVLRGRVLDPSGRGVPGVRLLLGKGGEFAVALRMRGWGIAEVTTDAEGSIEVPGLAGGELWVGTGPIDGYVEPDPVVVGADAEQFVLQLDRGATLSGRVVDPDGKPVPGANVRAQLPRAAREESSGRPTPSYVQGGWWATTDAQGGFALTGLPAGARVSVTTQPPAPFLPAEPADFEAGRSDAVLTVSAGVFVEGELIGEGWLDDGAEVVMAAPGSDDLRFASGAARAHLPAGTRRFRVGPVAAGSYELAVYVAGQGPLALTRGVNAPASGVRLALPAARHVVGWLVGEGGKGFSLGVRFEDGNLNTSVAAGGHFRVLNARPGRVTVVAFKDDDERYGMVEDVDPTAGPIEVRLQPGLVIEGRVTGLPEGEPELLMVAANGAAVSKRAQGVKGDRFRLVGMPPGTYDVHVHVRVGKKGAMLFAKSVVAGGPEVTLSFTEAR
jgi:protocatechuate 3,4-dioxygenase beta subunit